jgi:very-short-patch-repair endonuclease
VEKGSGDKFMARWYTSPELWEKLKPLAQQMRIKPTPAEDILWQRLRNRQLHGFKFRRQHSIERFIVDFYCNEASLIVEVDGPIHQYQRQEDVIRRVFIESQCLRFLRFSDEDVLHDTDRVVGEIGSALISNSVNNGNH